MSRLILGCASFGNVYRKLDYLTCYQLVKYALSNKIYHFDTSPFYGESQEILGKIILQLKKEGEDISKLIVSTKVGRYKDDSFDFSESKCKESVMQSLQLLNKDYLDIVFCHDIEFSNNINEILDITLPTLYKLKNKGLIKKIGISGLPLCVLDYVIRNSKIPIDIILTYCSYTLNYSELDNYIDNWKEKGCKVIHGGVTSMGLLTSQGPPSWHPADESIKSFCKKMNSQYPNLTEIAYNYVNYYKKIDQIMIGPCNLEEFSQYLEWNNKKINQVYIKQINEIKQLFVYNQINYIWKEDPSLLNIKFCEKK